MDAKGTSKSQIPTILPNQGLKRHAEILDASGSATTEKCAQNATRRIVPNGSLERHNLHRIGMQRGGVGVLVPRTSGPGGTFHLASRAAQAGSPPVPDNSIDVQDSRTPVRGDRYAPTYGPTGQWSTIMYEVTDTQVDAISDSHVVYVATVLADGAVVAGPFRTDAVEYGVPCDSAAILSERIYDASRIDIDVITPDVWGEATVATSAGWTLVVECRRPTEREARDAAEAYVDQAIEHAAEQYRYERDGHY